MRAHKLAAVTASFLCVASVGIAQGTNTKDAMMQNCPMHNGHASAESHQAGVGPHGDQAMGFSQEKTTHHFRLLADGGTIEVAANDPRDTASIEAIRTHLAHIAEMFGNGDFSAPMLVHDGVPPGATTMSLLKAKIRYLYAAIPTGGRVRIESDDPIALAAAHDFLRFQISEHHTGDSLVVAESH